MITLSRLLAAQSIQHPGARVRIVRPAHLARRMTINDFLTELDVNWKLRELYDRPVYDYTFRRQRNLLTVDLEERDNK